MSAVSAVPGLPGAISKGLGGGSSAAAADLTTPVSPTRRPALIRRETDQILSYYHSEHAGRTFHHTDASVELEGKHELLSDSEQRRHEPQDDASPPRLMSKRIHARLYRRGSTFSSSSDYSSQYSESGSDSHSTHALPHAPASLSSKEHTSRTSAESRSGMQSAGGTHRHSRRTSTPSEGGADRRRLAIVEMDANTSVSPLSVGRKRSKRLEREGKSVVDPACIGRSGSDGMGPSPGIRTGTLFSRRGLHIGGLALVAPPDASPKTYTDLTPPSTAPIFIASTAPLPHSFVPTHTRSASEAIRAPGSRSRLHHKSSRDVGIVGSLASASTSESLGPASPTFSDDYHLYAQSEGIGIPLFQTPAKSRPPSPGGTTPELSDTSSTAFQSPHQRLPSTPIFGMEDGIVTPAIGEGKDIGQPVVGPVIVGLSPTMLQSHSVRGMATATNVSAVATRGSPSVLSSAAPSPSYHHASSSSTSPSHYLHYQPGVHATAGPLPPPPRSIFDRDGATTSAPPRPPRFHTPLPNNARRDIDAIKEALQLPQSVSAKLAAQTPPEVDKRLSSEPTPCPPDSGHNPRCSEDSVYTEELEPSVKLVSSKPVHIREGAFPPSKIMSIPPAKPYAQATTPSPIAEEKPASPPPDVHPAVVVEQEEPEQKRVSGNRRPAMELHRESSWVSLSQEVALGESSSNGQASKLPAIPVSRSPSSISAASTSSSISHLPSLPPKSIRGGSDDEKPSSSLAPSAFKVITNLKRFSSLPRTPSRSSRSSKRSTSPSLDHRRSLSPPRPPSHDDQLPHVHVESPPRRRIVPKVKYSHEWPPAMSAAEIVILRSPRERAKGYAMKINELSMYDCGLREWLASQGRNPVSHPRTQSQRTATQQAMHALPVEFGGIPPGLRQVSHGSLASEATFPIRSDAYTATDLSARPTDSLPSTSPPAILPYPSLAQMQLQRAPARSSTLLLSPTKTLQLPLPGTKGTGTGFFASLGRKTSIRKEKGSLLTGPQSPTKVLSKQRPHAPAIASSLSQPTPVRTPLQLAPPSIPGGPRAAPGYIKRAKTYSVGPGVLSVSSTPSPPRASPSPPQTAMLQQQLAPTNNSSSKRQSTLMARRPSLFGRARAGHSSVIPANTNYSHMGMAAADPTFERQVSKLADLLPHADRTVLAGYLRRAGEDILAIGQYLEDEKNGTLRRD